MHIYKGFGFHCFIWNKIKGSLELTVDIRDMSTFHQEVKLDFITPFGNFVYYYQHILN